MGGIKIMKYYKLNSDVYAFESDGSQDEYITQDMVRMTSSEVDKHINPKKYMSDEQLYDIYVKSLKPLTRRQFKLALLANNLLELIDTTIAGIADPLVKAHITIEYTETTEFVRTSDSVKYMLNILDLTEEQANTIWEQALTL
jgi:hypothetical protein